MSGVLNLTAKEIYKNVTKKLDLQNVRDGRERIGEYWLDGKYQFRVKMPNEHGGNSRSVSRGFLKSCRETVHLNAKEYSDLVKCPMSAERYEEIVRENFKS